MIEESNNELICCDESDEDLRYIEESPGYDIEDDIPTEDMSPYDERQLPSWPLMMALSIAVLSVGLPLGIIFFR